MQEPHLRAGLFYNEVIAGLNNGTGYEFPAPVDREKARAHPQASLSSNLSTGRRDKGDFDGALQAFRIEVEPCMSLGAPQRPFDQL